LPDRLIEKGVLKGEASSYNRGSALGLGINTEFPFYFVHLLKMNLEVAKSIKEC